MIFLARLRRCHTRQTVARETIQKLLCPALEDHQGEEPMGVVGPTLQMLGDLTLDGWPTKQSPPTDVLFGQEIQHQRPELASQPVLHGNAESYLSPVEDGLGKNSFHLLFQDVLVGDAFESSSIQACETRAR